MQSPRMCLGVYFLSYYTFLSWKILFEKKVVFLNG